MTKPRSSRALANDAAIRAASIDLILKNGIDAISFRDVGREAGLTHGALYARFEDVEELLVDLWNGVLYERAVTLLEVASQACSNPSPGSIDAVLAIVRAASPVDHAMVQVLFASRRFEVLREEVEFFVRDFLEADESGFDALRSRSLALFAWMLIEITSAEQFGHDEPRLAFLETVLLETLSVDPTDVADVVLVDPTDRIIPRPENDFRSQVEYHTFSAVGRSGYTRATISRISRRTNSSPGAIYKIYPSKEDLVISAIRSLMRAPWISVETLADVLGISGIAQILYSASSEQNNMRKSFTLEMAMACTHNAKLCAAVEAQLRGLETLIPLIEGIDDEEREQLKNIIRSIVMVTLGTSFLSTTTSAMGRIDFNQFAEPFRQALLRNVPSWEHVRRQLLAMVSPVRFHEDSTETDKL